jgi:hypothetical protein
MQNSPVMKAIEDSSNPVHAAKTFLIQLAGDFLVESSAMSRNILGSYGSIQSELFKVVIDEYGYGVHQSKHSRLFEETLESVGLESTPHSYWQFYLTSSLMLNNYFNYISGDHSKFFRYLGAIFYAENHRVFVATAHHEVKFVKSRSRKQDFIAFFYVLTIGK